MVTMMEVAKYADLFSLISALGGSMSVSKIQHCNGKTKFKSQIISGLYRRIIYILDRNGWMSMHLVPKDVEREFPIEKTNKNEIIMKVSDEPCSTAVKEPLVNSSEVSW